LKRYAPSAKLHSARGVETMTNPGSIPAVPGKYAILNCGWSRISEILLSLFPGPDN
jgi:hypothetical protein